MKKAIERRTFLLGSALLGMTLAAGTALAGCTAAPTEQEGENMGSANQDRGSSASGQARNGDRILVAYYSAQGNTERAAKIVADELGADLFAITPENIYTDEGLDWTVEGSRVNLEHEDESLRDIPLVQTTPDLFEEYGTVLLGYPIWWGIAAWPTNRFVSDNDFTEKTVVPFCTSTSSGIGESGDLLAERAGTGVWRQGERFPSNASEDEIRSWARSL